MAEGDFTLYNAFKKSLGDGEIDLVNDTFKVILVAAHTPDIDADASYADVSGDEYGTGDGYTAGGASLASLTNTQDNANDWALWDSANLTWSAIGPLSPAQPSHAIIYDDTHASDRLVGYIELGVTPTNGTDFTIQTPSGLIRIA